MFTRRCASALRSTTVVKNRWQLYIATSLLSSSSSRRSPPTPTPPLVSPAPTPQNQRLIYGFIQQFNERAAAYPQTSLYSFLLMRTGTWYALAGLFSVTLHVGPELAVGYLLAKFSGKIRQPLNISLAALISHCFPVLSEIKASALLGIISPEAATSKGNEVPPPPTWLEQKLLGVLDWLKGPVDKYGFSLFVAGKINIALTILVTGGALKSGMDVSTILTTWGIDASLQNGAGAMAVATLTNMLLLPGHLWLLTVVSPTIDQHVQVYLKKLQEMEKVHRKQK